MSAFLNSLLLSKDLNAEGGAWYRHGGTNLMVPFGLSREAEQKIKF